jgi:hypothetical protein
MPFLIKQDTLPFRRGTQMDALADWREAEQLVSERWEQYMAAERHEAPAAYSAYLAALDAEEAAASDLEQLTLRKAA